MHTGRHKRTMEEPDTGVVCDDTQCRGLPGGDLDGVATDRVGLSFDDRGIQRWIIGRVVLRPSHDLILVPMQMAERSLLMLLTRHRKPDSNLQGVFAGVAVLDDDVKHV